MDKGTGKSYSSSACDSAGDAEVFRRSLYCRIYPESVGASKCGGSADWRNGGAAAGNSQYSCGKLVILPARYCCFFMNISAVWQEDQDGVPGSEGSRKYGRSWYIMAF